MNKTSAIAAQLASFAWKLSIERIPGAVIEEAKRCIVDTVGVIAAGQSASITKITRQHAIATYDQGYASIPGYPDTLHPMGAALINGTSGHAYDFDDTSYTGIMHASVVVLPAALAMAEQHGVSGRTLLEAFIAGVEIEYAIAELCTHQLYFKGWWTSGLYGTFGAAAACAIVLGLDEHRVANAISMATCLTSGVKASFGTDAKPLGLGMAASRGIECALLSASGLTGPVNVFEDDRGFLKLFNDNQHLAEVDLKLSQKWRLTDPGILFKSYPVCSAAQAGIELTAVLMEQHRLSCEDIQSVICEVPPLVSLSLVYDRPASIREAQFSMPFAVGCMLAYRKLGLNQLSDEVLLDPLLQSQMKKVEMLVPDYLANDATVPQRCPEGAAVTLVTHDQEKYQDFLAMPTGMPGNPIATADLSAKFIRCVAFGGVPENSAEFVLHKLLALEEIPNVREILDSP